MAVNTAYIIEALRRFVKALQKKSPTWSPGSGSSTGTMRRQTAQLVQAFLAKNAIQVILHGPTPLLF
jgi:hypothetical protein